MDDFRDCKRLTWNVIEQAPQKTKIVRSCSMKQDYPSKEKADEVAEKISNKSSRGPVHSYLCNFCHKFHIGH